MEIELVTFDKKNILLEGHYLIRTETLHGRINYMKSMVTFNPSKDEMIVDVRNQKVTHISKSKIH